MDMSTELLGITFICYLLLMLMIGLWAYRRTSNSEDYFLGGRNLGALPAAISAGASDMSGWLLMGLPGAVLIDGLENIWMSLGLLIGFWVCWLVMARRLRRYAESVGAITIPVFLARRFNDNSNLIQSLAAIVILVFFLFYTAAALVAGGKLFSNVFGLSYHLAIIIGAVCVLSYTLFGGFLAVVWTDVVQGLLMMVALIIVPIVIFGDARADGSWAEWVSAHPNMMDPLKYKDGSTLTWVTIVSLLAWGLGYFGQPHILARFKAIKGEREVTNARRISVSWSILCQIGALSVGILGAVYFSMHPESALDPQHKERVFMVLVRAVFHPVVAGILLSAILAAIMSTADSQLLVASSAYAEDLHRKVVNPDASSDQVMWVGRLAVVVVCLIAVVIGWDKDSQVLDLVSYAWAGFGSAFGPVLIMALFWRRMNRWGALAGMIAGAAADGLWIWLGKTEAFPLYEMIPGVLAAAVFTVVVSLLTDKPSQEQVDKFDEVTAAR